MRILHDGVTHRFVIHAPDGDGELHYSAAEPGIMNIYHVEVDPQIRKRGMGNALVAAAFEYAREHQLKIKPSCPYVKYWLTQHTAEGDVLVPM